MNKLVLNATHSGVRSSFPPCAQYWSAYSAWWVKTIIFRDAEDIYMANVSTGKLKMQKGAATMENTLQFLKRQTELLHIYQIIHLGDRKINVQPRNYARLSGGKRGISQIPKKDHDSKRNRPIMVNRSWNQVKSRAPNPAAKPMKGRWACLYDKEACLDTFLCTVWTFPEPAMCMSQAGSCRVLGR